MPYRKSLVQISFRLGQDVLRKLEREAKRNDRSTTDEITHRLEDSLAFDDWRGKRYEILEEMKRKLGCRLRETPSPKVSAKPTDKPRRSQSVQVRFRLREEILTKLEHQAKDHRRSTHDEIGIRLQASFSSHDPWEQLRPLISALIDDAASHDNPAATIAAYTEMDWEAERDSQEQVMTELFPPRRIQVRAGRHARAEA
jgi:hypothetical protein